MQIKFFSLLKLNCVKELRSFNYAYRNGFGRRLLLSRKISSLWIRHSFFKNWSIKSFLPRVSKIKGRYRFLQVKKGLRRFRYFKKINKLIKLKLINRYDVTNLTRVYKFISNNSSNNLIKNGIKFIKATKKSKYYHSKFQKLNYSYEKGSKFSSKSYQNSKNIPFIFKTILNKKKKKIK